MQNFCRQARFPSGPWRNICLITHPVPKWRNGRRRGFKIPRLHGRVSSNLTLGTKFRDWLINRSLSTSSIKRIFSTIRAVFNLTIQEQGLGCSNAFANTYLPSDERPKRAVISPEDIKRVQKVCLDIADERRLLIALISDTGMRLSEALGLVWDDIHLEHEYSTFRPKATSMEAIKDL
jgi:integrase